LIAPVRVGYSAVEAKIKRNMPTLARADLEALLRTRKLDQTLTSALPFDLRDEFAVAPANLVPLDAQLGGGIPRGQLSELVGPRSSGRTSVCLQMLAAATARGELVALVDALDMFDAASASEAGIDFNRLLWIRGHVVTSPGMCRDMNQRAVEQAIKALTLVLQAGNFGLVVLDMAEAPSEAHRRLPFTTWLRLQRLIEGSPTACVLIGSEPMGRSSAGLTVGLSKPSSLSSPSRLSRHSSPGLFTGLDLEFRVVRARARMHEDMGVPFTTCASAYV
jgi:recA bacterial DNA recombination protein